MDVSNKFLVVLLVIAIAITLIGTIYSVDRLNKLGFISGTDVFGYVNITISNQTNINVTATNCDFGTGYVTSPASFAELHVGGCPNPADGTLYCQCDDYKNTNTNWTNTTEYNPRCLQVRNDGNINLIINMSSNKNAATMIGGTNPNVTAWSEDTLEGTSCASGEVGFPGVEVDTSNKTYCNCLNSANATDELYVGCRLKIPDNAYGTKGAVWTFWAASAELCGT